jgi:predicted RNase H-like nuclease
VTRTLGVDAFHGGWVGILATDAGFEAALADARLEALVECAAPDLVAVDIPIGLVDEGWRACDRAAKGLLGPRRSSVFLVPPRAVVEATTYAEANRVCREVTGQGLSRQAYALAPKILEVDALVGRVPGLVEVHPEVSFRVLAGETLPKKKTWGGVQRRRALLVGAGIELPDDLGPANEVPVDDVLDATVAAWSGLRIARGEAVRVGDDDHQRRSDGEPIAIWA